MCSSIQNWNVAGQCRHLSSCIAAEQSVIEIVRQQRDTPWHSCCKFLMSHTYLYTTHSNANAPHTSNTSTYFKSQIKRIKVKKSVGTFKQTPAQTHLLSLLFFYPKRLTLYCVVHLFLCNPLGSTYDLGMASVVL